MKDKVFSTVYDTDLAGPYVWLPLVFGAVLGMLGLFLDQLLFTLSSAIFTTIAIWHWPYIDSGRVIIQLSDKGADIDGIGRIPWDKIDHVELVEKRKKNQSPSENSNLRICLKAPAEECAEHFLPMTRPNWQKKLVTPDDAKQLIIQTGYLLDSPVDLANAFAWFLKPSKS